MSSSSPLQSCKGLVYAITGCGGGIGGATAERLAELGAAGVAIADISEEGLQSGKCPMSSDKPINFPGLASISELVTLATEYSQSAR